MRKIKPSRYGWKGKYKTWEDASRLSLGYDDKIIINKVRESAMAVKMGLAAYERDSVLFKEAKYNWPLLTAFLYSYSKKKHLSIIDFGGSLGSSYYQNRKYLTHLKNFKWGIVEQPNFVKVGKLEFENNNLKFFNNIKECNNEIYPNVLLLSAVLQYTEAPYELLETLLSYSYDTIIIDRTPFVLNNEYVSIQYIPPKIYDASYPSWFFNEKKFKSFFLKRGYNLVEEFEAIEFNSSEYEFKGLIFTSSN